MTRIRVNSAAAMEDLGRRLARGRAGQCVVYLEGDLGAGKTTFARGVLRGLGYRGKVKSPTYTLLESYQLEGVSCFHLDLYRLSDPEELAYLGLRDLLLEQAMLLVEWPERGQGELPPADLIVRIAYCGPDRELEPLARSPAGRALLEALAANSVVGP